MVRLLGLLALDELELKFAVRDSFIQLFLLQQGQLKDLGFVISVKESGLADVIKLVPIAEWLFLKVNLTLRAEHHNEWYLVFPDHLPKLAQRLWDWSSAGDEGLLREVSHQAVDIVCVHIGNQCLFVNASSILDLFINLILDLVIFSTVSCRSEGQSSHGFVGH